MQMQKWLLSVILFGATFANADFGWDGREEALRLCKGMTFQNQIIECMGVVKNSRYFDQGALSLCSALDFDSKKVDCMRAIANKAYLVGELSICSEMTFDTQKIQCLINSGQNYESGSVDVNFIRSQTRHALDSLRAGQLGMTDQVLSDLLRYLDRVN